MKKYVLVITMFFLSFCTNAQNVGIGTTYPIARLHVADSNVVFTGPVIVPDVTDYTPPLSGMGARMMWYPQKAAFRVGYVSNELWAKNSIGRFSIGAGYNAGAHGESSVALGDNAIAFGDYAVAIGRGAWANYSSVALGGSYTGGTFASAVGWANYALGANSTAIGSGCIAKANNSMATGFQTTAKREFGFVTGAFNDTTALGIFEVGNGYSNTLRSNAMTLMEDGSVGFGIKPRCAMDLFITDVSTNYHPQTSLGIEHRSSHYINLLTDFGETGILFGNNFLNSDGGIIYRAVNAQPDLRSLYFRTMGNTRFILFNYGNAWLDGSLYQVSDATLKKNITPLTGTLNHLQQLQAYTYNWKDKNRDSTLQVGLLAQEVQKVYPQLVKTGADGELSVNYIGLVPVLLEGMKEQQREIDELKKAVKQLMNN